MKDKVSSLEAEVLLRNLNKKSRAEAILSDPVKPKWVPIASTIGACSIAQYALRGFIAPDLTGALIVGMFVGLVVTMIELWSVQRRLNAVIALMTLKDREQT